MKYFFPDSHDFIDPGYDFATETYSPGRVRQRDDAYAHEVFEHPPFDGLLVSRGIVEGPRAGKYTLAQQLRFRAAGAHAYLRAYRRDGTPIEVIGDCGAFGYLRERVPPVGVAEVGRFYAEGGFDYGIAVDHVILAYQPRWDQRGDVPPDVAERRALTLDLARDFLAWHREARASFHPIGVAQGWSPASYAAAVLALQQMGYDYVALGGMVGMKSIEILACLEAIAAVRRHETRLHLLGVSRVDEALAFGSYGVASLDSTAPLKMAFKDARQNYFLGDRTFMAIRVPQVDGSTAVRASIAAGQIDQAQARRLERDCLRALDEHDRGRLGVEAVVEALAAYETLLEGSSRRHGAYRAVLEERPWRHCPCAVCRAIGYHVILFRGAERNKRRGFHNLREFHQRLRGTLLAANREPIVPPAVPRGACP